MSGDNDRYWRRQEKVKKRNELEAHDNVIYVASYLGLTISECPKWLEHTIEKVIRDLLLHWGAFAKYLYVIFNVHNGAVLAEHQSAPDELLSGVKSIVPQTRTFGCKVRIKVPGKWWKIHEAKACCRILLPLLSYQMYRVIMKDAQTVQTTWHFIFEESFVGMKWGPSIAWVSKVDVRQSTGDVHDGYVLDDSVVESQFELQPVSVELL